MATFFNRLFGNNSNNSNTGVPAKSKSKRQCGRTCRIEELESREMLNADPLNAVLADIFANQVETSNVAEYKSDDAKERLGASPPVANESHPWETSGLTPTAPAQNAPQTALANAPSNALAQAPGNTISEAIPVNFTDEVFTASGRIAEYGAESVHMYKITVESGDDGKMYTFNVTGTPAYEWIRLFDADGNELVASDNPMSQILDEGIYYLGVSEEENINYDPMVASSGSGYSYIYTLTIDNISRDAGDQAWLDDFIISLLEDDFDQDDYNDLLWELETYVITREGGRITGLDLIDFELDGTLDVMGLTALKVLNCSYNCLTELKVAGHKTLEDLRCIENELTSLDVSGCTALKYLSCRDNGEMTSLNVDGCTALETLYCYWASLETLDVSTCVSLTLLSCYGNFLTSLNVKGCSALETLSCAYNELVTLDVSGLTKLKSLNCRENIDWDTEAYTLISLIVTGCTALEELRCYDNALTALDVSTCTALEYLDCSYNEFLSTVYAHTNLQSGTVYKDSHTEIIYSGTTVTGPSISGPASTATYTQNATATALTVTVNSSSGTPTFQWYRVNTGGDVPLTGQTSASFLPPTTATGTFVYYCNVTDANGTTKSGNATITVTDGSTPMDKATVVTFTNGSYTIQQTTTSNNEFHLYKLTVSQADVDAGRVYTFETSQLSFDGFIRLFNAAGTQLAYDDDSGDDGDRLVYKFTTAGVYYLGISSYNNRNYDPMDADSGSGGYSSGSYTLTITSRVPTPPAITDVTFAANGTFNITKTISHNNEFHLYKVTVTQADVDAGRVFTFRADSNDNDFCIRLFDANWEEWDSSWGETLYLKPTTAGTYYLGIAVEDCSYDPTDAESGRWGWGTGSYALNITRHSDTNLSVPSGVSVIIKDKTTLTVSWNAVPGANGYTIQYATDAGFTSPATCTVWGGTSSSYNLTGLATGTPYFVKVKANGGDVFSDSVYSGHVSATPKDYTVQKDYKITGLKAGKATVVDAISFTWTVPANQLGKTDNLKVELFSPTNNVRAIGVLVLAVAADGKLSVSSVESEWFERGDVKLDGNTISVMGLEAKTKYTIFVQARNSKDATASVEAKIVASTAKMAAVKITEKISGDGSVKLSWTDSNKYSYPGWVEYEIKWYLGKQYVGSTWTSAKTYTITDLNSQKYTFVVTAFYEDTGESPAAKVSVAPNKFDAVKGLKVTAGDALGTVKLTWTAIPDASYYITVKDAKGNVVSTTQLNSAGTDNYSANRIVAEVMITGLASQKYTFEVEARKSITGGGTVRSAIAKTSGAPTKYNAVSGLKAIVGDALGTVKLSWNAANVGADGYGYRILVLNSKGEQVYSSGTGTSAVTSDRFLNDDGSARYDRKATSVLITGLDSQKYTFVVQAYKSVKVGTNGTGASATDRMVTAFSAVAKTSALPKKYAAVTGLKVIDSKPNSVKLSWDASAGANSYRVEAYDAKGNYVTGTNVNKVAGNLPTEAMLSSGLVARTKYTFLVYAVQDVKVGTISAGVDCTVSTRSAAAKISASTAKLSSFTVTTSNVKETEFTLNWSRDENIALYEIYVVVGKERYSLQTVTRPTNGDLKMTFDSSNSNLKPGTKYSFIIIGYNSSWNLLAESKISVTTNKL